METFLMLLTLHAFVPRPSAEGVQYERRTLSEVAIPGFRSRDDCMRAAMTAVGVARNYAQMAKAKGEPYWSRTFTCMPGPKKEG